MNAIKIFLCSLLILIPCLVTAQGYKNPVDKKMPIVAWYSIESGHITKDEFKRLSKAGFNLSLSMSLSKGDIISSLQAAKGTGVKLIVQNRSINNIDVSFISQIKKEESLGLYYLYDEPSLETFSDLAEQVRRIKALDCSHLSYINLYPTYAPNKLLGTDSYQTYIDSYLNIVSPDFISFDFYPFVHNTQRVGFFDNLKLIYETCKAKGIVFWGFVKVLRDSQLSYVDEGMIRYQVFSNLAYGAQGLQYYTYTVPRGAKKAIIDTTYSRSDIYNVVARVNKEVQRQSKFYLNADFKSVVHSDTLQSNKSLASFKIKDLKAREKGIVLSLFEKEGASYVLMVNKDHKNKQDILIVYKGKAAIINKKGKRKKWRQTHNVTIEAGDGVLFQLK